MKRSIDVALSALGLVLATPVMVVIGLVIKLDSKGPCLFRQTRVGQYGNEFQIYKFRTMRVTEAGPAVTVAGDDRITRVGRWLRSTKLDEAPQLVNVLTGDMSLIGPRPEVPEYVELWPVEEREVILSVRPGISDPASIAFRRESEMLASASDADRFYREVILPEKVRLYAEYARTVTLRSDLRILVRTLRAVLRG